MIQIVFQRRYEEVALETQLHRARRVVNIQLIIGWALRIVPIIIVRLPSERRFRDARAIRLVRQQLPQSPTIPIGPRGREAAILTEPSPRRISQPDERGFPRFFISIDNFIDSAGPLLS